MYGAYARVFHNWTYASEAIAVPHPLSRVNDKLISRPWNDAIRPGDLARYG